MSDNGVPPLPSPDFTENNESHEKELAQLRAEIESLRAERGKWLDRQNRIMELIGCVDSNHIVHDIRNVLNERNLLRAVVEHMPEE